MKIAISTRCFLFCFAALLASTPILARAQDGVSTAGEAYARAGSERGFIPNPQDVAVEDFINYGRKEIGRPKAGQAVGLDVRWDKERTVPGREAVLQVGLSTAIEDDLHQLRPLNLAFAIDKSGSMSQDRKLFHVKKALEALVSQLRPTDVVSIVTFDSKASVLVPAEPVGDKEAITQAIASLEPGSATNLNAGLILAYREAAKHYEPGATNRVILLTDGIANMGVTEPSKIADNSLAFNAQGVDLCTIGVGSDVNQDLLRVLAKSGRGLFHFVENAADIRKVFVTDVQSQLSLVAQDPNVTIEFGSGLNLQQVFGFHTSESRGHVTVALGSLNSGATEVVLLRFRVSPGISERANPPVKIALSYYDVDKKQPVAVNCTCPMVLASYNVDGPEDSSVEKNVTLAELAQSIKSMAAECANQRYEAALIDLDSALNEARARYPSTHDSELLRAEKIAQNYRQIVQGRIAPGREGGPNQTAPPYNRRPLNLIPNGDFTNGNTGFVSCLPYMPPGVNALWGGNYTVAPGFENPNLHTLIAPRGYSSPKRPLGSEQVLFANAGGTDAQVLWSTVVRCLPHTHYRISFQTVSLSGSSWKNNCEVPTEDWVPNYQIEIGGERCLPQPGGCGNYKIVGMEWYSKDRTSVTVSIIRDPFPHGGGIIGIADIEMAQQFAIFSD